MAEAALVHTDPEVCRSGSPGVEAAFQAGLAKLASGVAIVAFRVDGRPQGLVVNSLTGLSMRPPRLLFCVDKDTTGHLGLLRAEMMSIALLAAEARDEAERFSASAGPAQPFDPATWQLDTPAPERRDALARFSGTVRSRLDGGTHTVFILDVAHAEGRRGDPLLYFERDFRRLA